ncbi:MAG: hypothetical protein AB7V32_02990 [Candidatus Berkiella sp.]
MKLHAITNNETSIRSYVSLLSKSEWHNIQNILERIYQEDGDFSKIFHLESVSPETKIEIALLQEISSKIHALLVSCHYKVTQQEINSFYIFIALLLCINKLAVSDEKKLIGWESKKSQIRILTDRVIEHIIYVMGDELFNQIKIEAINYVKSQHNWLDQDYIKNLANNLHVPYDCSTNLITNLTLTISALTLALQSIPLEKAIEPPLTSNQHQFTKTNHDFNYETMLSISNEEIILNQLRNLTANKCSFHILYEEIEKNRFTIELGCQRLKNLIRNVPAEHKQEIEAKVIKLNYGLIECYKVALMKAQKTFLLSRSNTKKTIHKIFHCYIKVIIFYIKSYRLVPQNIWIDLSEFYQTAIKHHVSHKHLESVPQWHNQFRAIDDLYKYCLLLGIIDFYQFRFDEITMLFYALESWAPFLILHESQEKGDGYFVDSNIGILHKLTTDKIAIHQNGFYINTSLLKHRLNGLTLLKNDKTKMQFAESELLLSKPLIKKIETCLNAKKVSELEFKPFDQKVSVQSGITTLFANNQKGLENSEIHSYEANNSIEYISINLLPNSEFTNTNEDLTAKRYDCHIISIFGHYLKTVWEDPFPKFLQPGNLISIYFENSKKQVQVGAIKALWIDSNNQCNAVINSFPQEASLLSAKMSENNNDFYQILFIPEQPNQSIPMSIIAPFSVFQTGQEIDVIGRHIEGALLIGEPFESYHSLQRFEVSFI